MALSTYDLSLWEISRRALKSEKLKFSFDKRTKIDIQKLSNSISDSAPSIIIDIKKDVEESPVTHDSDDIVMALRQLGYQKDEIKRGFMKHAKELSTVQSIEDQIKILLNNL